MMRTQVTLLLVWMLSSGALSLQCYPCTADPYTKTVNCTMCADQCASSTTFMDVYIVNGVAGLKFRTTINELSCGSPGQCVNTSTNLGMVKIANNTNCCSTNYCNNKYPPVLPTQPANGKTCYVCNVVDCSEIMSCKGAEDHCITGTATEGEHELTVKGCTTKNMCNKTQIEAQGLFITNLECCQGNLCNSADSLTLPFLLMFIPLISSILFY